MELLSLCETRKPLTGVAAVAAMLVAAGCSGGSSGKGGSGGGGGAVTVNPVVISTAVRKPRTTT